MPLTRAPTKCVVCQKGLSDSSAKRRHMLRFHPNHSKSIDLYQPKPQPLLVNLEQLHLKIVEPNQEVPSWKKRLVEGEERRSDHQRMVEELRRICNDDNYAYRRLEIREVEIKGYCVFTTMPISFQSPVCEYKGTYITRKEGKSVEHPYVFDFTHENRAMSIDATKHVGTVGRYISHSRDSPNVICQKVECIDDGLPHLIFFALRDIAVGEEIAYEYGDFSQKSANNHSWLGKPCLKAVSKVWRNTPS